MAEKYTYQDVIIDPNDERVEIGAEYYFALGAQACIDRANNDSRGTRLQAINGLGEYRPFISDDEKDYPFIIRKKEPSYAERQDKWLADNGINKGDKVRIVRKAGSHEDGWDNWWEEGMDDWVGKVFEVCSFHSESGILLVNGSNSWRSFPYFVLEKIEQKYVPFNFNDKEDRAKLRGAWIRNVESGLEYQVICIGSALVFVHDGDFNAGSLLEQFVFLDGTPCGKLAEEAGR